MRSEADVTSRIRDIDTVLQRISRLEEKPVSPAVLWLLGATTKRLSNAVTELRGESAAPDRSMLRDTDRMVDQARQEITGFEESLESR